MSDNKLSKEQLKKLRRISSRQQTRAKEDERPRHRSPQTEKRYGDRSQKRTPSLPPTPWKD